MAVLLQNWSSPSSFNLRIVLFAILVALALYHLVSPAVIAIYSPVPKTIYFTETRLTGRPASKNRLSLNLTELTSSCSPLWAFEIPSIYTPYARATSKATLYHGTTLDHAANILASGGPKLMRPDWKATGESAGALHPAGGFYLSDSAWVAAQYARMVWEDYPIAVIRFEWDPSGLSILEFNDDTEEARDFYNDFCWYNFDNNEPLRMSLDNDVISGLMLYNAEVEHGSWQYALATAKAMKGLTISGVLTDKCDALVLPPRVVEFADTEDVYL